MSRMYTTESAKRMLMDSFRITEAGCWEWKFGTSHGYGMMGYQGKVVKVCRLMYELFFLEGPIPKGACILHKCDNRLCINPDHLYMGTKADNISDRMNRNRDTFKGRQKISPEQADLIRSMCDQGIDKELLAKHYGVTLRTIQRLVSGK